MLRQPILLVAMLCALVVTGCDSAPTHDSVMKDSVSAIEDTAAILATVTDESSMNAAKPKLKEISEKMKALKVKQEKLGEPTKEKQEELKKQYDERMTKAFGSMLKETMRLSSDPKLAPIMSELNMGEK